MAFNSETTEKTLAYLGYPANEQAFFEIQSALDRIADLPISFPDSLPIIARIEGLLTQLDIIFTGIDTERDTEGSTLLPELRREGRRYVALVANVLGLTIQIDVFGSTQT